MNPGRAGRGALFIGGVLVVAGAAWWAATRTPPAPLGVVLITLDTTRVDRLSIYGSMDVSLPALERVAREGVVFDQATSPAPLTLPAHSSILTGLLPPRHGVRDNADPPLAESHTTIAEVLRSRGFRTGAFVGSVVLAEDRGLAQGFEKYGGVATSSAQRPGSLQRRGDAVIGDALQWLDSLNGSPFFLWAHLYDPHRPYAPPEPFYAKYGHDPYAGEIAYADSQVERLIEALERKRLLDRVVLVIAGDHGESLGDHGERDHGVFVYQGVVQVPLLIRAPRLQPSRVADVVRLTDVMPTILEMLHVPVPTGDGVSLVALMKGRRVDASLESYSESLYPERMGWSPLYALRLDRFKFIDAPRPELYDLDRDPFEQENIYSERRPIAEAMGKRLAEIVSGGSAADRQSGGVPPEVQERLAALGYVGASVPRSSPNRSMRPDPKDCISTYESGTTPGSVNPQCGPARGHR